MHVFSTYVYAGCTSCFKIIYKFTSGYHDSFKCQILYALKLNLFKAKRKKGFTKKINNQTIRNTDGMN